MGWSSKEDKAQVATLLRLDPPLVETWRRLTTASPGGDRQSEKARSTITDNISNASIPKHGTALDYTLARLARDRGDLFAKVCAKEMSANKAAIEAGIRKPPKETHRLPTLREASDGATPAVADDEPRA